MKIDGIVVDNVDQYDPVRDTPFSWSYSDLTNEEHTIVIRVTNNKNPQSSGYWINIKNFGESVFDAQNLSAQFIATDLNTDPFISVNVNNVSGATINLINYSSSGKDGSSYRSWLDVLNITPTPFSQSNPLRSGRVNFQN